MGIDCPLSIEPLNSIQDHSIDGAPIVPGMLIVELARAALQGATGSKPSALVDVSFLAPVLWGNARTDRFHLVGQRESDGDLKIRLASARGTVHMKAMALGERHGEVGDATRRVRLEDIALRCPDSLTGDQFYGVLEDAGNGYGPTFRGIRRLRTNEHELLADLGAANSGIDEETGPAARAVALDWCVQASGALKAGRSGPFLLVGIDQLRFLGCPRRARWLYAGQRRGYLQGPGFLVTDVRLLDQHGRVLVDITGLRVKFSEREDSHSAPLPRAKKTTTLAISATFTAEPLHDTLTFWFEQLGAPYTIQFAPFNQVLQQLLDTSSLLSGEDDGANVILLRVEDWLPRDEGLIPRVDEREKERLMSGQSRYVMRPGVEIAHVNGYETEYLIDEIFRKRAYTKHGIQLRRGDCVFDVGANIGLFTLFVQQECRDCKIYAFEPAPPLLEKLRINASIYVPDARVFGFGISDRPGRASFTYYGRSTVFSGYHADRPRDEFAIRNVISNRLRREGSVAPERLDELVETFMKGRLDNETYHCEMTTLSSVIEQNDIECIDLLKIDAEGSEGSVFDGISEKHWRNFRQIVVEVHDVRARDSRDIEDSLRKHGFVTTVDEESPLSGSGLQTIYAIRPSCDRSAERRMAPSKDADSEACSTDVNCLLSQFSNALRASSSRSPRPHLVIVCPPSPRATARVRKLHDSFEERLASEFSDAKNVYVTDSSSVVAMYRPSSIDDERLDSLGQIPYTSEFFTALATAIARRVDSLDRRPFKAIVLDCDQTLWQGVCSESTPMELSVDGPWRSLQEFFLRQHRAGMLLCLCSKNDEADVWRVFDSRDDMPLRREHFVRWRINWQPKSQNIVSLAGELELALSSFIFLDDSPVECAEVRSKCPEVLTLQLPSGEDGFSEFLEHVWVFDHARTTIEDSRRTVFYREEAERRKARDQAPTLSQFLRELELEVRIDRLQASQYERASQLTYRTTQFNTRVRRLSFEEIRRLAESVVHECLVVYVRDRYGDYGLVGLVIFECSADALRVETFLLSCRALGRGVEHRILARLGAIASERGVSDVTIIFEPTRRNVPVSAFLRGLSAAISGGQTVPENAVGAARMEIGYPADALSSIRYDGSDERERTSEDGERGDGAMEVAATRRAGGHPTVEEVVMRTATRLNRADRILHTVRRDVRKSRPELTVAYEPPVDELETVLAQVLEETLGIDRIGREDNFFDLGGDSLKAVRFVVAVEQRLSGDRRISKLSPATLADRPTIREVAAAMRSS